ncbi:MAG TPA: recombinase-like helix-turn-helix domain-containing protein [Stellaceae bacterium]|nr:recombinase-like helix-turn-helix domain-containing protein [Stellaceae bacterium]
MRGFNPHLTPHPADKGSEAGIEHPDRVENIAWQTRAALPTPAENALADALQAIFADEIYDLPRIVERLQGRVTPPGGASRWSEALLRAELARLGS